MGTDQRLKRAFLIIGDFQRKGVGHLDKGRNFFERDRAIGVQEAVIADLHEAGGGSTC